MVTCTGGFAEGAQWKDLAVDRRCSHAQATEKTPTLRELSKVSGSQSSFSLITPRLQINVTEENVNNLADSLTSVVSNSRVLTTPDVIYSANALTNLANLDHPSNKVSWFDHFGIHWSAE